MEGDISSRKIVSALNPKTLGFSKEYFDLIVYTSSIEHMHPDAQRTSLVNCQKLSGAGTLLYLTCPVTQPGEDGYNTQYRAHVYEPGLEELATWLREAGWKIDQTFGLSTKVTNFKSVLRGKKLDRALRIYQSMPRAFALPAIAAAYPETATEIALKCSRTRPR